MYRTIDSEFSEPVHWLIDLAYLKGVRDVLQQLMYSLYQYRKDPLINEIIEFLESSLYEIDEMIVQNERSLPPFSHLGFKYFEKRIRDLVEKPVMQTMKEEKTRIEEV